MQLVVEMPYNDFVGGYLLLPLTLKLCVYCTPPEELFMASPNKILSFDRQTRAQSLNLCKWDCSMTGDEWVDAM